MPSSEFQGLAVDWIFCPDFSLWVQSPFWEDTLVVGGAGLFLTFWRSLGGSLAEEVVFMNTRF